MDIKIKKTLEQYGIDVNSNQEEQLKEYMLSILEYNKNINLTAITDPEEFVIKHYVDSLTPLMEKDIIDELDRNVERVLDLGTGGGFPGVPMAIMLPEKKFTLLDSLNKRLKIIDEISSRIAVNNIKTLHGRAEDGGRNPEERENYDLCLSRAVSHMAVLAEYALPFVKKGGMFIAYKGWDIDEEMSESQEAIERLGGKVEGIRETVTNEKLVIIRKMRKTPSKYPRKAGEPKKNPIGIK